jgi:hypothetical protein
MEEKLQATIRRVTLKQLRALAAVARTGTLTAAAQDTGVTPQAVALQLDCWRQRSACRCWSAAAPARAPPRPGARRCWPPGGSRRR